MADLERRHLEEEVSGGSLKQGLATQALQQASADSQIFIGPSYPPLPCESNTKSQHLTETTPTVAVTRGRISRGQSRTWFQKLREEHLLLF